MIRGVSRSLRLVSKSRFMRPALAGAIPMVLGYQQYSRLHLANCESAIPVPIIPSPADITSSSSETWDQYLADKWISLIKQVKKYFGMLKRVLWCTAVITPACIGAPIAMLTGKEEELWEYIVWVIENLGPSFIKLAQWASTRPDLFPTELTAHLERLQDSTRTHPWSTAEHTLNLAFGEDWRDVLDIDQAMPIGSGCIAQVYKGYFKQKDGKRVPVAIKLIHPHIEENLIHDMNILKAVTWFIELFPSMRYMSLSGSVNTFSTAMQDQLDLRMEADHMLQFADDFKENKQVLFPTPIESLVTRNALVETYCEGVPITKFMGKDTPEDVKLRLSNLCCHSMLDMVFVYNFVHGDLHPGNILVDMKDVMKPKLIFLDCGIVTKISRREHQAFVDICLALINFDGRKAGELMLLRAGREEDQNAVEGFCGGIQSIVSRARNEQYFENVGKYVMEICELSCKYRVKLVHEYLNVAMAVKVCEGISLALDPKLELTRIAIPTILKAQAKHYLGLGGVGGGKKKEKDGRFSYIGDSRQ
jgi:aarF domain-containing kinase